MSRRVRHGAAYELTSPAVDFLAAIVFDDLDGLQAYLRHPAHQELGVLLPILGVAVMREVEAAVPGERVDDDEADRLAEDVVELARLERRPVAVDG